MIRSTTPAALAALATLLTGSAIAAPLDQPACEQLRQDIGALEKSGARINFAKGPAWAKANLKPDQMQQVQKLIETEAQFLFRCPQPKRQLDAATEQLMEHGTGSDPDPDAAQPAANPAAKPAPARKAAPKAAAPAPVDAVQEPPPAPRPKRAAAKPKPADAYQPPAAPVAQ